MLHEFEDDDHGVLLVVRGDRGINLRFDKFAASGPTDEIALVALARRMMDSAKFSPRLIEVLRLLYDASKGAPRQYSAGRVSILRGRRRPAKRA